MKKYLFIIIGLALALGITIPKLYKMAQIRGFIAGAAIEERTITQVWHQKPEEHHKKRNVYWISWTADDIKKKGEHRLNVEREIFEKINVNDRVPFIKIHGDKELYLRDGIYASTGNFIFDGFLLIIELVAVGYGIVQFRRKS